MFCLNVCIINVWCYTEILPCIETPLVNDPLSRRPRYNERFSSARPKLQ